MTKINLTVIDILVPFFKIRIMHNMKMLLNLWYIKNIKVMPYNLRCYKITEKNVRLKVLLYGSLVFFCIIHIIKLQNLTTSLRKLSFLIFVKSLKPSTWLIYHNCVSSFIKIYFSKSNSLNFKMLAFK